jgi:hypothetical protein
MFDVIDAVEPCSFLPDMGQANALGKRNEKWQTALPPSVVSGKQY